MLQFDINIANYLDFNSVGEYEGADDWGIYAGLEPEKPNNCITVFDIGGKPLHNLLGYTGCFFRIHIRVRGTNDVDTLLKCQEIYDLLKFQRTITANGAIYENILAETNILPGGRDKNNRLLKAMNFTGLYNN